MKPRPYQQEAIDALDHHLNTRADNPCVVIPTGGGKSPVMAWAVQNYKLQYRGFRAIILAHTKELVHQNADKLRQVWPNAPIGIYAAGLRRRDMHADLMFASIDSVYRKGADFDPFDLIFVDEAHRIPMKGEGKYRTFIAACKLQNPKARVVGMTATPYRMGVGNVCHRDHILNHICYEANVADLIRDRYLCPLRSKAGKATPDLGAVTKRGGEYVVGSLADATDRPELVSAAISEAMPKLADRQAIIFFCVDVDHCKHVSAELRKHGVDAPCVTGNTPSAERDRITADFVAGRIRAVCNVNVLTEGFDATRTDAIVLLRPTKSKGLYYQMVGRGLRLDQRKADCLVLDFAGCIDEHGPIDELGDDVVRLVECPECDEVFSRATRVCPDCGWQMPKEKREQLEREDRERRLHATQASERSILSTNEPETLQVTSVSVNRHKKPGAPDSLRINYRCGLSTFREWVCLDHPGYAGQKAKRWWGARFDGKPPSVDEALQDIFLGSALAGVTEAITVKKEGRYFQVVSAKLVRKHEASPIYE